ncbi:MAG: AMP-binding protein [Frankia sp.]
MDSLINWVDERSRTSPGRVYLREARGPRTVTYGELAAAVDRWRDELTRARVGPGERVALVVADPLDFSAAYLGIVASGRVAVPLSPSAPAVELARSLDRAAPTLAVADRELPAAAALRVLPARCPAPGHSALGHSAPARRPGPTDHRSGGDGSTGGVLLASSGTTGTPKQILLTEAHLMHTAAAVARHHQLTAADNGYNPLPLFHVNAEVVGLLSTLVAGAGIVLDDRFHRRGFWSLLTDAGVTWVNAVPAILAILAAEAPGDPAGSGAPAEVRFVRSASAPLPVPVLRRFERATGLRVLETYGMTEAASQITANPLRGERRPGSVGLPVGSQLRVLGPDGRELPAGAVGRVQVRGGGIVRGYVGGQSADRFDADGWLDTGDLGHRDADGYLYLDGRADDVINRGGEKIFPREVEEVLLEHPGVGDAIVVGRPDPVLGEVPVALVRPAVADPEIAAQTGGVGPDRAELTDGRVVTDLLSVCEARLDRFKRPAAIEVVTVLPTGPTGKVLRRAAAAATGPAAA